jgi:hypothetical protein
MLFHLNETPRFDIYIYKGNKVILGSIVDCLQLPVRQNEWVTALSLSLSLCLCLCARFKTPSFLLYLRQKNTPPLHPITCTLAQMK